MPQAYILFLSIFTFLNLPIHAGLTEKQGVIYRAISTGQIRINPPDQIGENLVEAPVVLPPLSSPPEPPVPVANNPVPVAPRPRVNILELNLSSVPAQDRGILYDSSRTINQFNPVRVINSSQGGYTSIFVQDDQYFNISIGTIPTSGNGLKPVASGRLDVNNLQFLAGAVLQSASQSVNLALADIDLREVHNLDLVPRGRRRYASAQRDFRVNGFLVPAGFIVIGTREAGLEHVGYPGLKQFESFRVYDPNTGALVKTFGQNALAESGCLDESCFRMDQFATPEGTEQFGAHVYSNFSTQNLFLGKNSWDANKLWIAMQANLEAETVLNINAKGESWTKHILEELNDDELNYIGHIERYELAGVTDRTRRMQIIRDYFGFQSLTYPDAQSRTLHDNAFEALWDLAVVKNEKRAFEQDTSFSQKNKVENIASAINHIRDMRTIFENKLAAYDNYIRALTSPPVNNTTVITNQPNTPTTPIIVNMPIPSPLPPGPKKQEKKEEKIIKQVCKKTGLFCS